MKGSETVIYDFKVEISSSFVLWFFLEDDIFWFDISVHDTVGLKVLNSLKYLLYDGPDEVRSHIIFFLAVGNLLVESDAMQQL